VFACLSRLDPFPIGSCACYSPSTPAEFSLAFLFLLTLVGKREKPSA
jgi:hypothetical protein